MSRYERDSVAIPLIAFGLFGLGMISLGSSIESGNADDRVRDIQPANEQVHEQLDRVYNLGRLVLNDEDHTFTFVRHNLDGSTATCAGHYEQQEDMAQVVGELVCSQAEPAIPK